MSDFKVSMWLDDEPPPMPEKKAVGEWRCECGLTMVHPRPTGCAYSVIGRCLTCGDDAEVFPG